MEKSSQKKLVLLACLLLVGVALVWASRSRQTQGAITVVAGAGDITDTSNHGRCDGGTGPV